MDTYKTAGTYRCQSASVATSLTNCPVSTAFKLIVDVGNDYLTQKIIVVANTRPVEYKRNYYNSTWGDWLKILTNADYEVQTITNSYGINIHLIRFGNDNVKVIRLSGYINKALTAGTEYIIATNAALKSRVDWYHNVFVSGKGSELKVYLNIDKNGNVKITPHTAIASGLAINMMEYYV